MRSKLDLDPSHQFKLLYNDTKKTVFANLPANFAEFSQIARSVEYQSYHYRFTNRCSDYIDLSDMSDHIEYTDFRTGNTKKELFRHERNGRLYFFLPGLLHILRRGEIVADGTFSMVKHLEYTQVYIIAVYYREGSKCFTMPIVYSLMKTRRKDDYNILFTDVKYYFKYYMGEDLNVNRFKLDMEMSAYKAILHSFPGTEVVFCRVHFLRNITKWLKHYFGAHFYNIILRI